MMFEEYDGWKNREVNTMSFKDTMISLALGMILLLAYIFVGTLEVM